MGVGGSRVGGAGVTVGGGAIGGSGTEGDPEGGGGAEAAAPFSPIANYDFGLASTITLSGSEITDVVDRVGNSNLTRVTEGPDEQVAWQNGRNGADIGSISAGSRGLRTGTSNPTGFADNQSWTVGFVADIGALASAGVKILFGWMNGAYSAGWAVLHANGVAANRSVFGASDNFGIGTGAEVTTAGTEGVEIYVCTFDDSDDFCRTYVDGSTTAQDADDTFGTKTNDAAQGFYVGGDSGLGAVPFTNAIIGEIVIYNSLLVEADRTTLATYLNDKWAVY